MKVKSLFIIALACVAFMAGCKKNNNNAAVEEILDSTTENEDITHWTTFSQTYLGDMAGVKAKLLADGFELYAGVDQYKKTKGSFTVYVQPTGADNKDSLPTILLYTVGSEKKPTFLCNREKFLKLITEQVTQNFHAGGENYSYASGYYYYNGEQKDITSWSSLSSNEELKSASSIALEWNTGKTQGQGQFEIMKIRFSCDDNLSLHSVQYEIQLPSIDEY